MFSLCLCCLWYLHEQICLRCLCFFFSSERAYAVYDTFTSEYVYYVFCFFSSGCVYAGLYVAFLLANMFPLFMAPYNISTLLWYFFISERICLCCYVELLPANMFCAVICYFCKRIWLRWFMDFFLKLLCVCGYMEFFANALVHAVMRFYGRCYLCFLRDLGLRHRFLFLSFLCMA